MERKIKVYQRNGILFVFSKDTDLKANCILLSNKLLQLVKLQW